MIPDFRLPNEKFFLLNIDKHLGDQLQPEAWGFLNL
jgi:hypothetical protein